MVIPKWTPTIVTWTDAATHGESYDSEEFVASYRPMVRRTVGFFLYRDDKGIYITETDDREGNLHEDCERITVIPPAMILRTEVLGPVPPVSVTPILDAPSKRSRRSHRQR